MPRIKSQSTYKYKLLNRKFEELLSDTYWISEAKWNLMAT